MGRWKEEVRKGDARLCPFCERRDAGTESPGLSQGLAVGRGRGLGSGLRGLPAAQALGHLGLVPLNLQGTAGEPEPGVELRRGFSQDSFRVGRGVCGRVIRGSRFPGESGAGQGPR